MMLKFALSALLSVSLTGCFNPKTKEYSLREYEEKFVKRQFSHMRLVQDNMFLLSQNREMLPFEVGRFELIGRSVLHDVDKVVDKPDDYFKIFKYKFNGKNGISNGGADEKKMAAIRMEHQEKNRHHFEYYVKNKEPLTGVDICEIVSDIYAIKIEKNESFPQTVRFMKSQIEKYNISKADGDNLLAVLNILNKLRK
jgi:hypothetical protein